MVDAFFTQLTPALTTFVLISLAEIGDKSQLVCMTLAARHRPWPVLLGAVIAFSLLNALAVIFGAGVAAWLPEQVTAGIVALLFAAFGFHALRHQDDEDETVEEKQGNGIFMTTLLLIFVAEFGDKTQIAVAGLAGTAPVMSVWVGATLALVAVSALGIVAGRTLLQRIPLRLLHRISGAFFLLLAALALGRALGVV